MRGTEEDQRRKRRMAFLDIREPTFPGAPVIGELLQSLDAIEAQQHLQRRGRGAGTHFEHIHRLLTPREGGVHGGQIGDQQRHHDQPEHGF